MNDSEYEAGDSPSLTQWGQEPTLRELQKDLTLAGKLHNDQSTRIEGWLDNLHVTGKAKVKTDGNRSSLVPRLIRKQAEWRYASLSEPFLSDDDIIEVSPVTWEDAENAKQTSLLLNHQFRTALNRVGFIDEYVRTGVDEGTILVRTGWEYEEEEVEVTVPAYDFLPDPTMQPILERAVMLEQANPTEYQNLDPGLQLAVEHLKETGQVVRPVQTGEEEGVQITTTKNQPTAEIWAYDDVFIDPLCKGDISKARFVIFRSHPSRSDLEKAGKYHNLDQLNNNAESILGASDDKVSEHVDSNFDDDARKKLTLYEYWGFRDIDGSGVVKPIVASWVGDTIIQMEENPYPDKEIPLVVVQYLPVRKHIYGEPDGALLEDNQKVLGATIRGMIDIMARSANGQMGVKKGALDTINRRRFRAGENYEYNSAGDPRNSFHMHTFPEIPVSAQFMMQMQNSEAESLTGVKAYNQGISGQALGEVAAGVRGALDAASKRELGILRRMAEGITAIMRKWLMMSAEFLSDEEVIRITNSDFATVRKDDLAGKFDLKLSISTAEEDAAKAQELAFMLQTVGPNTDFNVVKIILMEICRLRKMPHVAKLIEEFQPQADPIEQENKRLEGIKLRAEIAEIQARTQEHLSNARLDDAKAHKEVANARSIQSDADRKDLDFLEQESGVHQERELERLGAQAQGNIELENHKFALSERAKSLESLRNFRSSQ